MQTISSSLRFAGKVAVVTGGSSGIGLAIATNFVAEGAEVVITGRDAQKLAEAAQEIGSCASWVNVEVNRVEQINELFARVQRDHGHIDILVVNAGGGVMANLGLITEEQVDHMLDTNVKGVIFTVQGALPLMSKSGAIILIGSSASIDPPPGMSVYGATKAAMRNLMRAWVAETKGSGIRINTVSPGPTRTPGLNEYFAANPAALAYLTDQSTVGRLGEPDDVAVAVAFLASDQAGYINGVELFVDGGASQI